MFQGSTVANDDDFFRAPENDEKAETCEDDDDDEDEDENRDSAAESEEDDSEKTLQQVDIKMLQVDWLTERPEGRLFLTYIAQKKDCLRLFESQTVKFITEYLWTETYSYFVIRYFMPFIVFGFLPLLIMAFMMPIIDEAEGDGNAMLSTVYLVCIVLFNFGSVIHIYDEINEMIHHTPRRYIRNLTNYYQWAMICVNCTLTYKIWLVYFGGQDAKLEP